MRYIEVFYKLWRPHTHNDGLPSAGNSAYGLQLPKPATTRRRLTKKKLNNVSDP